MGAVDAAERVAVDDEDPVADVTDEDRDRATVHSLWAALVTGSDHFHFPFHFHFHFRAGGAPDRLP